MISYSYSVNFAEKKKKKKKKNKFEFHTTKIIVFQERSRNELKLNKGAKFFTQFYCILNKNNKFFLTESKELKLKTNRNYPVYERGCSLFNASLFTLKLDSFSQLYFLKQHKL